MHGAVGASVMIGRPIEMFVHTGTCSAHVTLFHMAVLLVAGCLTTHTHGWDVNISDPLMFTSGVILWNDDNYLDCVYC